jgi:hypothetical protein
MIDEVKILRERKYLEAVNQVLLEGSALLGKPEALYLSRMTSKQGNKPFKAYRRGSLFVASLGGFEVKQVKTTNPFYAKLESRRRRGLKV